MGSKRDQQASVGPVEDGFSPADIAIARHRDSLKARFPLEVRPAPRIRGKRTIIAAVCVLSCAALVWLDPAYRTDHLATAVGQQMNVDLADGSHLVLNTDTRLDISWHLRSRRVGLVSGQAVFDVAHSTYRPFTVNAGDTQVTVVGTMFDVWRRPDTVKVTVLRGRVRVDQHGATTWLTENQQAIAAEALSDAATVDAAAQTGWKEGKLIFDRAPLREVLAEMQRYTRNRISLADTKMGNTAVSGVFEIARADGMLDLLPTILPVAVLRDGKGGVSVRTRPTDVAKRK